MEVVGVEVLSTMGTRIFTREELDELGLPDDGPEVVSDRMVLHKRWSVKHELIFRLPDQPTDRAWMAYYFVAATESQEQDKWDGAKTVTATEVALVERTVKVWEPVAD